MSGWIKLHRSLLKHWIATDPVKLHAWITILLEVNYKENKVLINDNLFTVGVGESLKSLDTWATLFGRGWNKSKVRRFFELLKKDSMVVTKSEHITTRLSVLNFESYQSDRNADETQMKQGRNADDTQATPDKKDKKDKKDKNEKKYISLFSQKSEKFQDTFDDFINHREDIKKPMSWNAKKLMLMKLQKINQNEAIQIEMLNQSILKNYSDVFEVKGNFNNKPTKAEIESAARERFLNKGKEIINVESRIS